MIRIAIDCPRCGKFVTNVRYVGDEQLRCRNRRCGVRLTIISDGKEAHVSLIDRAPPQRVTQAVST